MQADNSNPKRLSAGSAQATRPCWRNGTVLGIGLASLFSDWSHEIATTAMLAFLATAFGLAS